MCRFFLSIIGLTLFLSAPILSSADDAPALIGSWSNQSSGYSAPGTETYVFRPDGTYSIIVRDDVRRQPIGRIDGRFQVMRDQVVTEMTSCIPDKYCQHLSKKRVDDFSVYNPNLIKLGNQLYARER